MYIEKLEIKGFGKVSNLTLNFNKGFNIIYGLNESGKTTIQWFIKGMLFGLKGGRASKEGVPPPLRKYKPWDGGVYGGVMEYRLDNNKLYRIERDFESGSAFVYDSMFKDITSEFYSSTDKGTVTAEKHILLDQDCFEKIGFIKQMESSIDEAGRKELLSKITNVMQTGFEDISFNRAEKALRNSIRENVGSDRTTTRPLDRTMLRLEELNESRSILVRQREQYEEATQKLEQELETLEEINKRKRVLQKIQDLHKVKVELERCRNQKEELKCILEELLLLEQNLKNESEELKVIENKITANVNRNKDKKTASLIKKKRKYKVAMLVFSVTSVFFFIFDFFVKSVWTKAFFVGFLMFTAIVTYINNRFSNSLANIANEEMEPVVDNYQYMTKANKIIQLNNVVKEKYNKVSLLCGKNINSLDDIKKALDRVNIDYGNLFDIFNNTMEQVGIDHQKGKDLHMDIEKFAAPLSDSELESIELVLEYNIRRVNDEYVISAQKIMEFEASLKALENDRDELQRVDEEIEALTRKKEELESLDYSLRMALETLMQAGKEIQREYIPELNKKMGNVIEKITSGRYHDIRSDDKLRLRVVTPEAGKVTATHLLSGGTIDQIYLALRLSMAELVEDPEERLPFILDEIFSCYDDSRTSSSLRLLDKISLERQIILFTCKGREVELASRVCTEGLNIIRL